MRGNGVPAVDHLEQCGLLAVEVFARAFEHRHLDRRRRPSRPRGSRRSRRASRSTSASKVAFTAMTTRSAPIAPAAISAPSMTRYGLRRRIIAVLERARFALGPVDHDGARQRRRAVGGHRPPLRAGGNPAPPRPRRPGGLDRLDHRLRSHRPAASSALPPPAAIQASREGPVRDRALAAS